MTGSFTFEIGGRLTGLNEINKARQQHWAVGQKEKAAQTDLVCWAIRAGMVPAYGVPVRLAIAWHEPNAGRDIDNVRAGVKFILDALVKMKRIPNDTRQWVRGIADEFPEPDPKNPRVVVTIIPVLAPA